MVLTNKKETWNLNTVIAGGLAILLVSLFSLTWSETSLVHLQIESLLTIIVLALTAYEIRQHREHLIHGAIVSLTILPWVFYLLMAVINLTILF